MRSKQQSKGVVYTNNGGLVDGCPLTIEENEQPPNFSSGLLLEEIETHVGTISDE